MSLLPVDLNIGKIESVHIKKIGILYYWHFKYVLGRDIGMLEIKRIIKNTKHVSQSLFLSLLKLKVLFVYEHVCLGGPYLLFFHCAARSRCSWDELAKEFFESGMALDHRLVLPGQ